MAVTLVQQGVGSGPNTNAPGTITLGGTPAATSILVLAIEGNDTPPGGPTVTSTNTTWTPRGGFQGDASHDNFFLYTGVPAASAGTTITMTWQNTVTTNWAAHLSEFGPSTGLDIQAIVPPATNGNLSSATPSITSGVPSTATGVVAAYAGHVSSTAPTATPSGWTALTRSVTNNSLESAYKVLSNSSPQIATWTFAGSQFILVASVVILDIEGAKRNGYTASSNLLTTRRI